MIKSLSLLLFLFLTLFVSLTVQSADLKIFSAHFPPYALETENGKGAGALYDVVVEVLKRQNLTNKIDFIPWPRARFEAENKPDIVILPLARTKEREDKYAWVLHVLDDPYVLIALKSSKFDISSVEASKKLKIGILTGSVADFLLREMGFTNLEVASNDVQNVKKLKLGRIDAWVAPLSGMAQYQELAGIGKDEMRVGVKFTELREYVGASKSFDKETIRKWEKAFESMKKDGTYQSIMKKYGMTPLP